MRHPGFESSISSSHSPPKLNVLGFLKSLDTKCRSFLRLFFCSLFKVQITFKVVIWCKPDLHKMWCVSKHNQLRDCKKLQNLFYSEYIKSPILILNKLLVQKLWAICFFGCTILVPMWKTFSLIPTVTPKHRLAWYGINTSIISCGVKQQPYITSYLLLLELFYMVQTFNAVIILITKVSRTALKVRSCLHSGCS